MLLVSRGFEYEEEFRIENRFYDFRVGKYLFEVDPYPTHNVNWSPMSPNEGIDKYYHRKKTLLANRYGYICIHIFDWTDAGFILSLVADGSLATYDTGNIKRFVFNTKTKSIQESLEPYCVEIYDDGFEVVKEKS